MGRNSNLLFFPDSFRGKPIIFSLSIGMKDKNGRRLNCGEIFWNGVERGESG